MKILHILDHSLPLHSGYTFRSQNIFRAQRNRKWQPVILTSPKHEENWKKPCRKKEEIEKLVYYRTGYVSHYGFPFEYELKLMHALSRRILNVAKIEKPDIIHAHSPVLNAIPAIWAAKKLNLPVVYEIRALWEDAAVDHKTYKENSWKYKLTKSIETWVCKQVNHVAVLCNGIKNDLIDRGISRKKITPVFNGVNPNDFKPCPRDEQYLNQWKLSGKKVIGFIGSFYRYEGLDLLVEAFSFIAEHNKNAVLLLVGGGEMKEELTRQIKSLDIADKVIMPGRIAHERIPGIYSLIDILAYPRYAMRLTNLVTPLKPLEAMAMGKALIASDVGGHKELIRHNETGILFPAGNSRALAETLDGLLNNDALRQKMQTTAIAWVRKNHTWEKTTSVYQKIYAVC